MTDYWQNRAMQLEDELREARAKLHSLGNQLRGYVEDRFYSKVKKEETGCWVWTAFKNSQGYGKFSYYGKQRLAHRISWEFSNGSIPEGVVVCHRCDNPSCVNPDHLFLGTVDENVADRNTKGRTASCSRHGRAKLSLEDVKEIRELGDDFTRSELGRVYGVSAHQIYQIVSGRQWIT